ncbi:MAG: hypothetical protein KDD94_11460 [Calditrichaeota bacterium]|nr:hypothetical protein [Calditrichota bacterium]
MIYDRLTLPGKQEIFFADPVYQSEVFSNIPFKLYLPVYSTTADLSTITSFLATDEHLNKIELSYLDNHFFKEISFRNAGLRHFKIFLDINGQIIEHSYSITVQSGKPTVDFYYYTDKTHLYINASKSKSPGKISQFAFSFNGQRISSESPTANFKLPLDYGLFEISVSAINESDQFSSKSEYLSRNYQPLDLDLNLSDKKTLHLLINKETSFNFKLENEKEANVYSPDTQTDLKKLIESFQQSKKVKNVHRVDSPDSLLLNTLGYIKPVLNESDLAISDSVNISVDLSIFDINQNDILNFYINSEVATDNIQIPEFSILRCKAYKLDSQTYFFEPLNLYLPNSKIINVTGEVRFENSTMCKLINLGSSTLTFEAKLNLIY